MKKYFIALLFVIVAAVLLWFFWPAKQSYAVGAAIPEKKSPVARENPPAKANDEVAQALRSVAALSNKPIEFFGVVVDQHEEPIAGVKVVMQVRGMREPKPGVVGEMFEDVVTHSDASGHFSITGVTGSVLTMKSLEKDGYLPSKKAINVSYRYWDNENSRYKPDASRAEVFHMWKKSGAEAQVRHGFSVALHYDGTPTRLDLLQGKEITSAGDLTITLVRNPQKINRGQSNYEWTLVLEAPNGGIIGSTDEQMYLAPVDGYQSKLIIHVASDAADWTDEKTFSVYLKLRGGAQYGRAEVKALVGSDRATTPFYLNSFVNPNGSRNLEDTGPDGVPSSVKSP